MSFTTYRIVRFFQEEGKKRQVLKRGVTLREAQEWCQRKDTEGEGWFDGYELEGDDRP